MGWGLVMPRSVGLVPQSCLSRSSGTGLGDGHWSGRFSRSLPAFLCAPGDRGRARGDRNRPTTFSVLTVERVIKLSDLDTGPVTDAKTYELAPPPAAPHS